MFEQTTLKDAENYTIQNPEQTLTTFVDSRRKINFVLEDPTKLSDYIVRGIEEWAHRMQVTLGTESFVSQTDEVSQTVDETYFREKMANFFEEKKPFEDLSNPEKVEENLLKPDDTQKEKLANFLLIVLNINDPGLLHASSAFLAIGFLMTGINYRIEGCERLVMRWTSGKNIYFNSNGVIMDLEEKNIGEFIYSGFINIRGYDEICIQDYLKLTSYDECLTSTLEYIIKLFRLPRKNIHEILDNLISLPKECNDLDEVSILIRELIYRTYQELLKKSEDCEDDESQYISNLLTWLNERDENNKQDRKNEFWWRVERRLHVFLETKHTILSEGFEITGTNVLLGIKILNILQKAIIRKIMINIFNDYKFIFCELVDAIKNKKSQIPQDLVNKAEDFLSENQSLDSSLTDPKSVIECYKNKIIEFFSYFKEQLGNSSRINGNIWFFKFFNPPSPLEKYINGIHKQTIEIMDIFAKKGDYHLFITSKQNNSSQLTMK